MKGIKLEKLNKKNKAQFSSMVGSIFGNILQYQPCNFRF
jgi:hypothetical protein